MTLQKLLLTCVAALALVGLTFSQARGPIDLPVEMDVPIAPTPFKADGKMHLVYELHLTNFASSELMLTRVEVLGRDQTSLAAYEDSELNLRLARPGLPPNSQQRMRL